MRTGSLIVPELPVHQREAYVQRLQSLTMRRAFAVLLNDEIRISPAFGSKDRGGNSTVIERPAHR